MNKGVFGHVSAFFAVILPLFAFSSLGLVSERLSPLEILLAGLLGCWILLKFVAPSHLRLHKLTSHLRTILAGALLVPLTFFFLYMAFSYTNGDTVSFMLSLTPALAFFVAYALRVYTKETAGAFTGAVFAVIGSFLLTVFRDGVLEVSVLGMLYSFGAAFCLGAFLVTVRGLVGAGNVIAVVRRVLLWGLVLSLPLVKVMEFDPLGYMALLEPYLIVNLLFCAVLVPCISVSLLAYSVKYLGLSSGAGYIYAFPAMSVIISSVSGNIGVSAVVLAGVVISVIAVAVTVKKS